MVVVGGGVTGAFAAYFLARRRVPVTLVEREEIGGAASGNNAGNLAPLHGAQPAVVPLALASFALHREHVDAIRELSRADVRLRPGTRLYLETDDRPELEAMAAAYEATPGLSASRVGAAAVSELEPRLVGAGCALAVEGNLRVDGGPYTRATVAAAEALGARTVKGEARGLVRRDGRAAAVELDSGALGCAAVVLAPGAWCVEPARWLGVPIPVEPLKGELVLVEPEGGGVRADLSWGRTAVYAHDDRTVWVGDTEERSGFDRAPTSNARASILDRAAARFPELGRAPVAAQKAGLRPVTPDGLPIVGTPDGWENVCLAVGGGRKGLLLGAAIGLAAADIVTVGRTAVPVDACSPARWRRAPAA